MRRRTVLGWAEASMPEAVPVLPKTRRAAKPKPPLESEVQRAILDYLATQPGFYWRANSGAMFGSHKGKKWAVRFGVPGQADILGLRLSGRFVAIEVKRPGKKPSDEQLAFLGTVAENNGLAFWADSFESFLEQWERNT